MRRQSGRSRVTVPPRASRLFAIYQIAARDSGLISDPSLDALEYLEDQVLVRRRGELGRPPLGLRVPRPAHPQPVLGGLKDPLLGVLRGEPPVKLPPPGQDAVDLHRLLAGVDL